jgi:putative addiction module component (TIGR02574 family)
MTSVADDVWQRAMTLTVEQRRKLAYDLLETLEEKEPGYNEAWQQEIDRRIREDDEHPDDVVSMEEAEEVLFGRKSRP